MDLFQEHIQAMLFYKEQLHLYDLIISILESHSILLPNHQQAFFLLSLACHLMRQI